MKGVWLCSLCITSQTALAISQTLSALLENDITTVIGDS